MKVATLERKWSSDVSSVCTAFGRRWPRRMAHAQAIFGLVMGLKAAVIADVEPQTVSIPVISAATLLNVGLKWVSGECLARAA